jgi:hypothetical protein
MSASTCGEVWLRLDRPERAVTPLAAATTLNPQARVRELLPSALLPGINDLTVGQLIALRFASDAELPDLCIKVLDDNIQDRKAIKRMIRNWQADHLRA